MTQLVINGRYRISAKNEKGCWLLIPTSFNGGNKGKQEWANGYLAFRDGTTSKHLQLPDNECHLMSGYLDDPDDYIMQEMSEYEYDYLMKCADNPSTTFPFILDRDKQPKLDTAKLTNTFKIY